MDGKALAQRIRAEVTAEIAQLGALGLATILVGDDPANDIYIRRKHEAAAEAGMRSTDLKLPEDITQADFDSAVAELNAEAAIDGILIQLPLPGQIDEATAIAALDPVKDVDGVHPFNAGQLYLGRPTHVPATPLGIMALLAEHSVPIDGARAVVVGRSDIVGKPVAHLLLQGHATVSICHTHTDDLPHYTLDADVLVVAAGRAGVVTGNMVKEGSAVVDVGVNRTDEGLIGDVEAGAAERAAFLTPVPGGVGPMTIAMLLQNTVRAARYRRGLLAFPGRPR